MAISMPASRRVDGVAGRVGPVLDLEDVLPLAELDAVRELREVAPAVPGPVHHGDVEAEVVAVGPATVVVGVVVVLARVPGRVDLLDLEPKIYFVIGGYLVDFHRVLQDDPEVDRVAWHDIRTGGDALLDLEAVPARVP